MTTINAKRIQAALAKAKTVGRVEQEVTIDGCPLVLQSLAPSDYEAILMECEERSDLEYLHAYQAGHVCRAIIGIGDEDFHDVEFIEDEVPSAMYSIEAYVPSEDMGNEILKAIEKAGGKAVLVPPDPNSPPRAIKVERHEWLKNNIVRHWGREALTVAWRKFTEVVIEADSRSKEGIQFLIPDETAEEKYRRLINEMKETENELPVEIVSRVLEEAGYKLSNPLTEVESAVSRLDNLAKEQDAEAAPEAPAPAMPQQPTPTPQAAPAPAQAPPQPVQTGPSPDELMQRRQPLNQRAIDPPMPRPTQQTRTVPAAPQAPVPEALREAAMANTEGLSNRAQRIAALEGHVDPSLQAEVQAAQQAIPRQPAALLEKPRKGIDGKALVAAVDQPPPAGINPRFKPQR